MKKTAKIVAVFAVAMVGFYAILMMMDQMLLSQRASVLTATCQELSGVKTPQEVEDVILRYNPDAERLLTIMTVNPPSRIDYGVRINATDSVVQLNLLPQVKDERHMVSSKLKFTMGRQHVEGGYIIGEEISNVSIEEKTMGTWIPSPMQSLGNHHMAISAATNCQIEFL